MYIGETARSTFERGLEHLNARENLKTDSAMLKHCILFHENLNHEEITFNMQAQKFHKSAFERQIHEAVMIQIHRDNNLMNSRAEFNRCSIPRLSVKMGQKVFNEKSEEEELLNEQLLEEKIKRLKGIRKAKNCLRGPKRKKARLAKTVDTETDLEINFETIHQDTANLTRKREDHQFTDGEETGKKNRKLKLSEGFEKHGGGKTLKEERRTMTLGHLYK